MNGNIKKGQNNNLPRHKQVRYAVVGLGNISQAAILPGFLNAQSNSKLTALVSDDPKKLEVLVKKYGAEQGYDYKEFDKCLRSGNVDAVYIALPNNLHLEYTLRAAKAGVHVLCEKPLALDEGECEEMIRTCHQHGVKLMGAYRLHFQKCNLEAIEIVKSGKIGEARYFNSTFSQQVKAGVRTQKKMGGGSLYDLGIYCINAARYLFQSDPEMAMAFCSRGHDARFREVDEMTAAVLQFPGKRLASFTCSFGAAFTSSYEVIGTKGTLRAIQPYDYSIPATLEITVNEKTTTRKYKKGDQFGPELIYFSDCILKDREREPNGWEGLEDVHVIRSLYESARTGRAVKLEQFKRGRRPSKRQEINRRSVKPLAEVHNQSSSK